MANEPKDEQAAQAAQIAAAQPSRAQAVPPAEGADEDAPDDPTSARAPRVWLVYNPKSGVRFGHIPTQGSGTGGELTPDETQHCFTRAEYDQAIKRDPPIYQRARKADLRPNQPYVGEPVKEDAPHGES